MNLNIPEELISTQLNQQLIPIVIEELEKRLSLLTKSIELPPYPNKSEVKSILKIGDDRLDSWIAEGLPYQIWGKDHRIEREVLQQFLRETKQSQIVV